MNTVYHLVSLAAIISVLGCSKENSLSTCEDSYQKTCGNWTPGTVALCYADGPGPAPVEGPAFDGHYWQGQAPDVRPGCGSGLKDRFGAPAPVTDGAGEWDWWCCRMPTDGGASSDNVCASAHKGTICEATAADPIHGECDGDGTCEIQEWTCLRNPMGTACIGGYCDDNQTCCSGGCLGADGTCHYGIGHVGSMCPTK